MTSTSHQLVIVLRFENLQHRRQVADLIVHWEPGRVSDSVAALKANVGDVLSKYLANNNMDEGEGSPPLDFQGFLHVFLSLVSWAAA